jgi:hypothetical protein
MGKRAFSKEFITKLKAWFGLFFYFIDTNCERRKNTMAFRKIRLTGFIIGKMLLVDYAPHMKWDADAKKVTDTPDGTYDITVADSGNGLETIKIRCDEPLTDAAIKHLDNVKKGMTTSFLEVSFDNDAYAFGRVRGIDVAYEGRAKQVHVVSGLASVDNK